MKTYSKLKFKNLGFFTLYIVFINLTRFKTLILNLINLFTTSYCYL